MSHHKKISHVYNPDNQTKEELLANFVVRLKVFEKLFRAVKESKMDTPEQHFIIQGQRGSGKTTLLLKLAYEIDNDPELSEKLIPVRLNEEQYNIFSLCRLWETVGRYLEDHYDFTGISEVFDKSFEDKDYPEICFKILEKNLQQKNKKIVLLIDNIADFFEKLSKKECEQLRDILHQTSEIRIIGASAKTLEQYFRHDKPFFEFFKTIYLKGLSYEETEKLLLKLAENYEEQRVEEIVKKEQGRVETLRRLTAGVPRTIILLFEILIDESANVFEDLELILDRITPLYKHRMDDLSGQQQAIMDAIALFWDPVGTSDIARQVRLDSKAVSAQLKQLEKNNLVRSEFIDKKNKLYFISERFFNIWYLMRYGRKQHRDHVLWLVRFLRDWCSQDELIDRVENHIRRARQGDINARGAAYMCEALACCLSDMKVQHELISSTKEYLKQTSPEMVGNLTPSDLELFDEAKDLVKRNMYSQAYKKLKMIRQIDDATVWNTLAILCRKTDFTRAEKYCKLAVDAGHAGAMNSLANLYREERHDLALAEKYYKLAVDAGHSGAMFNLALLYKEEKHDLALAEKYYKLVVEAGHAGAMNNLANLYWKEKHDLALAEKYYKLAVEAGDAGAMNNLSFLYFKLKKNKKESLVLASKAVNLHAGLHHTHTLSVVLLWHNKFIESYEMFMESLSYEPWDEFSEDVILYLIFLLGKRQYHLLLKCFKEKEFQLKERYKPIYYALMTKLKDEYPKEYMKISEELKETVSEILAEAEKMAKEYGD